MEERIEQLEKEVEALRDICRIQTNLIRGILKDHNYYTNLHVSQQKINHTMFEYVKSLREGLETLGGAV